ncbi:gliding motility-associated C-terminal domain-containing protein [Lunatimonas salinarum]|uniref:gliding motility-associated C-terminal domain-containing protein n=1 Tax=Lunatimonas salinarum TaxID=1774590 RepID=UPI001AE098C3|nr:gliding motility-associated C-terminal domain-containing protein [Lunatimonas salinarum]
MKSLPNYINHAVFVSTALILLLFQSHAGYGQGFNNNEWIFGYCEGSDNNYLSFGKDGTARVKSLSQNIVLGKGNTAMAVDPISGEILFYTDGALVYNYLNEPMQGIIGELGGDETGRQSVAIAVQDFNPTISDSRTFYLFFINRSGELEYNIVDMNNQGGAPVNQPPAGAVTAGGSLGEAQGAIVVLKTPTSASHLVSYNNGNLMLTRIEETTGQFTSLQSIPLDITPKAFVFDEDTAKLIVIPQDTGEDLLVFDFDASAGTLGDPLPLDDTGGEEPIEGAAFSPNGEMVYFSRGDGIFRIRTDGTQADEFPEEGENEEETPVPSGPLAVDLGHASYRIYDLRVGPDGQLYYIYEETEGGPQFVGRISNPDEEALIGLEGEPDPFEGADFCGTVFTVFTPTIDVGPKVAFTWEPDDPCMNNPLLLTSQITPLNYRPVSFDWEILPPLVDEEGEEIELDLTKEHLLLPREATAEQQVTVRLTVTFANGETSEVTQTINFQQNDLQVQFNPADTTLCDPACIDLMPLVDVQSGQGQGGQGGQPGQPGIGGPGIGGPGIGGPGIGGPGIGIPGIGNPGIGGPGGGGQGGNYEYFWSNKREEGWGPEAPNEVCRPGYYWVLVREVGSTCYSYAGIRIQMWDVQDQTNNIWYFGDGAGLDFNPDPDDPEAPTPRPIANPHPQNIPAGVTTVSDQAGQVLFYTDGQTVWDLNGDPMQNGLDIGGDNLSAGSVLAVPVSSDETLFYLFTTQTGANGTSEVKFSMVDIKGDNQEGIGNVVTKDNFLFSSSTEHSAALNAGDTTWVAFHEVGNNTFRMYPVSGQGIGQPVFNSVGGVHGFGGSTGVMKFAGDGSKLAVTYVDGGTNKLQIFDFDQNTGELTEFALLDLGTDGEVYGLEFSSDNSRVYVSYRNGGPGVEEFFLQSVEDTDETDPDNPVTTRCQECFDTAQGRAAIEQCILDSRAVVDQTAGLDLGALQVGPDGQIYAAVVGSNRIGQILPGNACNPSTFNQDGVEPMPGTTNLGLPAFVQQSGSSIPDPGLSGPDRLCLGAEEGAVGLFEGGGEPDIDLYNWRIYDEQGTVVDEFLNGGEDLQNLEYQFQTAGIFTVELEVNRCGEPWDELFRLEVEVVDSPDLILPSDIALCGDSVLELLAVDPEDPRIDEYVFQWVNAAGDILGDQNILEVTEESIYTVTVAYRVPEDVDPELFQACPVSRSVFVGPPFEFEIDQSAEEVCLGETVNFTPNTPVAGSWSIQLQGSSDRIALSDTLALTLETSILEEAGDYELFFLTADPLDSTCVFERSAFLRVNAGPAFDVIAVSPAESCEIGDGSLEVQPQVLLDSLLVPELDLVFFDVLANDIQVLDGLQPGVYTLIGYANGCATSQAAIIENANPPSDVTFEVEVRDEGCGPEGSLPGGIDLVFPNGPASGSYEVVGLDDGEVYTGTLDSQVALSIDLPAGRYTVAVSDVGGCVVPAPSEVVVGEFSDTVEVELFSPNLCGEVLSTSITASGDFLSVDRFAWFREVDGELTEIVGEEDLVITVAEAGRYEVRLYNEFDCILGSETIEILQSNSTAPILDPRYVICPLDGNLTELIGGAFASYSWVLDGEELSTEPQFTPTLPGSYELRVLDEAGCEFVAPFEVEEDCEINVTFPNAIIPGSPTRNFVVYTKGPIDLLGVFIYNRWGELIFYCEESNPSQEVAWCAWDGYVNGQKVPVGTYPVVVRFSNEQQQINQTIRKAIVVIE